MRNVVFGQSVIYVKTLTLADTWYRITEGLIYERNIISWSLKARETTDNPFDIAFKGNPSRYLTNDGRILEGYTNIHDLWVRSPISGTIIELYCFKE
jgi:hypothetical protein